MPIPRTSVASIDEWPTTASSTAGTVSFVSPPAKSIGLLRLHRGGSNPSRVDLRSSGRSTSSRFVVAVASAASTPHPPTVVTTATRGPAGTGRVANAAAISNASATELARAAPICRHIPSNTRSSVASEPVWLAAAFAPDPDAPPFRMTTGIRRQTASRRSAKSRPSATPSRYTRPTVVSVSSA
ncbi:unannotated protein [freshwater metagenome]|uniref:Unannotated protein n=1 Tax=freshwater metagenome TaxID=449393 RepID=A0A6J6P690_9ZZZZ